VASRFAGFAAMTSTPDPMNQADASGGEPQAPAGPSLGPARPAALQQPRGLCHHSCLLEYVAERLNLAAGDARA
jgi:hypothetical protein